MSWSIGIVLFFFIFYILIKNLYYLYIWIYPQNNIVENLDKWEKEEKEHLQK